MGNEQWLFNLIESQFLSIIFLFLWISVELGLSGSYSVVNQPVNITFIQTQFSNEMKWWISLKRHLRVNIDTQSITGLWIVWLRIKKIALVTLKCLTSTLLINSWKRIFLFQKRIMGNFTMHTIRIFQLKNALEMHFFSFLAFQWSRNKK